MAAISVTLLLVSLAGIPPLLGFWGKFQVFAGAITASGRMFLAEGNPLLGWTYGLLAVAGIVGSVISLAYYGSVLQALYLADQPKEQPEAGSPNDDGEADGEDSPTTSVLVVLALAVVVLGLVPMFMGMSTLMLPFTVR
jgi:NADH-quinone oxidoreductase subunit N